MKKSMTTAWQDRRADAQVDGEGFGAEDPFLWMENDCPELHRWLSDQQRLASEALAGLPERENLRLRLIELNRLGASSLPVVRGRRLFFAERGDEDPASLWMQDACKKPRPLIDSTVLQRGEVLFSWFPSPDGRLVAFRVSRLGSSLMSLRVLDVAVRRVLDDEVPSDLNPAAHQWHTSNPVVWTPDSESFYYTRRPLHVPSGEERYHQKLYLHRLGEDPAKDERVFGEHLRKAQCPYPRLSSDGRHLLALVRDLSGTELLSDLYLCALCATKGEFSGVAQGEDGLGEATVHGDWIYFATRKRAPHGEIARLPIVDGVALPGRRETLLDCEAPLRAWRVVGDWLLVELMEQVASRLYVHRLSGERLGQVRLPEIGSIGSLGPAETGRAFFSFSSFFMPPRVCRLHLPDLESEPWRSPPSSLLSADELQRSDGLRWSQDWCTSGDGTRIPLFILRRKGLVRDGTHPAVLHGYGGFAVSLLPSFRPNVLPFLERGGVYAIVNARGGGEFGEDWHREAVRENKCKSCDDFIAAAEWLVDSGWTRREKLGSFGWSNGGLLVNMAAVRRPDLFKAVVAGSPVTDLVRFHTSHAARHWIAEYGDPENPDDLSFLLSLSPYHALPERVHSPAMLFVVPDEDDRVAPWHGYKMLAAWQHANASSNPLLLRTQPKAGHRGSPKASERADLWADIWAFLFAQLGIAPS